LKSITLCLADDMNNFCSILGMEILYKQTMITILQENTSIIPDVIPDVKKPLEPSIWFEENDDEDFEGEFDEFSNIFQKHYKSN